MDRERKICIWYRPGSPTGLRRFRRAGYCWSCPCRSRVFGVNTFGNFSDVPRGDPRWRHPYDRCWDAIHLHLWRHHRNDRGS